MATSVVEKRGVTAVLIFTSTYTTLTVTSKLYPEIVLWELFIFILRAREK